MSPFGEVTFQFLDGAEGLKSPDVAQRFSAEGSTPDGSSPEHFSAHIQSEIAKWRKLVKDAGLALH